MPSYSYRGNRNDNRAVVGTATMVPSDALVKLDASAGAFTFTLGDAAAMPGKVVTVKRVNTGVNAVTLASAGGSLSQDGLSSSQLAVAGQARTYQSDGVNWICIGAVL